MLILFILPIFFLWREQCLKVALVFLYAKELIENALSWVYKVTQDLSHAHEASSAQVE